MNKNHVPILFFALLFLLPLAPACAADKPLASARDYFPLEEGLVWKYQKGYHNDTEPEHFTVRNLHPKDILDKKVTPRLQEDYSLFTGVDENGIYEIARQDAVDTHPIVYSTPYYILKEPIQQGTSWKNVLTFLSPPPIQVLTIESTDETVTVPAGTFNHCLRIQCVLTSPDQNSEGYSWYAPKVGFIKSLRVSDGFCLQLEAFSHEKQSDSKE